MNNLIDKDIDCTFEQRRGIAANFTKDGEEYLTVYDGELPRKAFLDVTTWKGVTKGALHYYGEIKIPSLKAININSGKKVYIEGSAPKEALSTKIQLTRPIRKRDLLIDRGERFKGARLGERIKNFDTRKEVENAAVKLFKKHFSTGWVLVVLDPVKNSTINGVALENKEKVIFATA